MSLKDEVEFVKDSLTSDEKILESAFKLERIYKKNKFKIWTALAIVVLLFGGNIALKTYNNSKLQSANLALLDLQKDPTDSTALATLKEKNSKLYELFRYAQAKDTKSLTTLSSSSDRIISDASRYHAGILDSKPVDSQYYKELALVEEAYAALKDGKKDVAKQKLSLVGENSPVSSIARLLRHYTLEVK